MYRTNKLATFKRKEVRLWFYKGRALCQTKKKMRVRLNV